MSPWWLNNWVFTHFTEVIFQLNVIWWIKRNELTVYIYSMDSHSQFLYFYVCLWCFQFFPRCMLIQCKLTSYTHLTITLLNSNDLLVIFIFLKIFLFSNPHYKKSQTSHARRIHNLHTKQATLLNGWQTKIWIIYSDDKHTHTNHTWPSSQSTTYHSHLKFIN